MNGRPTHEEDASPVDAVLGRLDDAIGHLRDTAVEGTLTGWKVSNGRWGTADLCATSRDGDGITHRLPVTIPPAVTHVAQRRHGPHLASGATAIVHGHLEIGDRWNPLRLVATRLDIVAAESNLATERRTLLDQLDASGDTHRNRARPLPAVFTRIGLVTPAADSAGRTDFLARLALSPTPIIAYERRASMSGPNAPAAIATAIGDLATTDVDAIIACRGGGATADLAAFDTAAVARAIVTSRVPVVVAVGHAIDRSVADHVAHTSLPTPTAAADWIVARAVSAAHTHREQALRVETTAATNQARHAHQLAASERARADRNRHRARIALITACALAVVVLALLSAQLLR